MDYFQPLIKLMQLATDQNLSFYSELNRKAIENIKEILVKING